MQDAPEDSEYSIRTRALTSAECTALRAAPPSTWPGTALVFLIWCVFPSWLFGWLARQVGMEGTAAHLVGVALGLTLFLALWVPTRRATRALQRAVDADVGEGLAQLVAVRGARFSRPLRPAPEPRLVAHVGEGTVLALQGEWLNEGARFGCTARETEWDDRHFNGLPEPWAFPCSAFTLHRLPISGRVLRIEVEGPYAEPAATRDPSLFPHRSQESTLLDSSHLNSTSVS